MGGARLFLGVVVIVSVIVDVIIVILGRSQSRSLGGLLLLLLGLLVLQGGAHSMGVRVGESRCCCVIFWREGR